MSDILPTLWTVSHWKVVYIMGTNNRRKRSWNHLFYPMSLYNLAERATLIVLVFRCTKMFQIKLAGTIACMYQSFVPWNVVKRFTKGRIELKVPVTLDRYKSSSYLPGNVWYTSNTSLNQYPFNGFGKKDWHYLLITRSFIYVVLITSGNHQIDVTPSIMIFIVRLRKPILPYNLTGDAAVSR